MQGVCWNQIHAIVPNPSHSEHTTRPGSHEPTLDAARKAVQMPGAPKRVGGLDHTPSRKIGVRHPPGENVPVDRRGRLHDADVWMLRFGARHCDDVADEAPRDGEKDPSVARLVRDTTERVLVVANKELRSPQAEMNTLLEGHVQLTDGQVHFHRLLGILEHRQRQLSHGLALERGAVDGERLVLVVLGHNEMQPSSIDPRLVADDGARIDVDTGAGPGLAHGFGKSVAALVNRYRPCQRGQCSLEPRACSH